jgi:hypothetical protein
MSSGVVEIPQFVQRLDRVAVSFAQTSFDVIDLVLLGMLDGEWLELEGRARRGLALARDGRLSVPGGAVHDAATSFRYARGLISAEDFLSWLRERGLSSEDLGSFLARGLLRGAADGEDPDLVSDEELAEILWAEAICAGTLASLAASAGDLLIAGSLITDTDAVSELEGPYQPGVAPKVLELAATAAASGLASRRVEELGTRLGRIAGLQMAMARLRDEIAEPRALQRVLASHGLQWLSVTGTELQFTTEGAALEARLLLIADRVGVEGVARLGASRSVGPPRASRLLIADAAPELAGAIVAAQPGEVVGPWPEAGGHRLLLVEAKQPPTLEAPSLREMAIAERLAEALNRHGAGRVERPLAL